MIRQGRSVEFCFSAAGYLPSIDVSWEQLSWLLIRFMFLWTNAHQVIAWEPKTCYCVQTNEKLDWPTADTRYTPIRITDWLLLHWNLIFTLELNLLLSRSTGNICDCISETHVVSATFYHKGWCPKQKHVMYSVWEELPERLTQDWNSQLKKDTWRECL